jgi:hypothetical protein
MGQDGFYDYAYCYFLYSFYLPDNYSVVIRNYTDTNLEGSLFMYKGDKPAREYEINKAFISAILAFMYKNQGVISFAIFDKGYKYVKSEEIKDNYADFSFLEIEDKE